MSELRATWGRFWFAPQSTSSLAVLRVGFGLLVFGWTAALAPDLGAFFDRGGLLAGQPHGTGVWGVLGVAPGAATVQVLYVLLLISSLALTAGYHTRLASVLVFVGVLSFQRRNPYIFNTGDGLIRLIAFYLMLAPAGESLSLDRRRSSGQFWDFPARAPWALRLMQIQLSILYLSSAWLKTQGTTWNRGTAVSYALRVTDLNRFPLPHFLADSALMANLLTYGTLAMEVGIAVLVWNRRLRPWVLAAGASLHLGIDWSIRVGFFSLAMFTLYLAFLSPEWASAQLLALRSRRRARVLARAPGRLATMADEGRSSAISHARSDQRPHPLLRPPR